MVFSIKLLATVKWLIVCSMSKHKPNKSAETLFINWSIIKRLSSFKYIGKDIYTDVRDYLVPAAYYIKVLNDERAENHAEKEQSKTRQVLSEIIYRRLNIHALKIQIYRN